MPPDNLCPTYSSKPWDHKVILEGFCVGGGNCWSLPEPEPEFEEEGEDTVRGAHIGLD